MKILFLQDDFPPESFGGAGISTYEIALGMKEAGHDVSVITTCRKESEAGESEYKGLKVFKIATDYNERWRAYVSLYNRPVVHKVEELLKQIRPDVVHINNVHFYLSYRCLKIAKRYAKAVVFTARDVMSFNYEKLNTKQYLENFNYKTTWIDHLYQAKKRYNPLRNFLIKRYLRYADKIIAISHALKDALGQNGIKGAQVVYNGINIKEWQVDSGKVEHFRTKHNLVGEKILLFGGRLSATKGAEKVIESLADIVKEVPDVVLLVMGKVDWYADIMKKKAERLGVGKHLVFTGWVEGEEIKALYSIADIVLMPSICFDAFGRVNIEAMVSKKPVIGTCYGGTPEIVEDGVTGFVVNPIHVKEITEKTLDLLKDPEKAERFGNAGYDRVKRFFNLSDKINEMISCYEEVIKANEN